MRVSALFGQTLRESDRDAEDDIPSHRLLRRAGYVRRLGSGIYSFLPLGQRTMRRIADVLREEMDAIGGQEVSMPVVQPADAWRRSGRWDSIDPALVRFRDRRGHDMVLAMTHEEVVTGLARTEIRSHRDLPVVVYQIQTKFRDEPRPRAGLIRTRELLMKDAYSFDRDQAGLDHHYAAHRDAYTRIFARVGLPVVVVRADPGIMGGGTSDEFVYLTQIGEDVLARCGSCGYAANLEVREAVAGGPCPRCHAALEPARGVEVGHIFQLGTRYSRKLGAMYADERGVAQPVVMGCYGIGLGRLLACLAEAHHDQRGLTLPPAVAPYRVALIAVSQEKGVLRQAEELYAALSAAGIDVLYDDRAARPGVKFADADLRGIPLRVTVSPRTLEVGSAELMPRSAGEPWLVPLAGVVHAVAAA